MKETIPSQKPCKVFLADNKGLTEYLATVKQLNNSACFVQQQEGCRTWYKEGRVIAQESVASERERHTFKLEVNTYAS